MHIWRLIFPPLLRVSAAHAGRSFAWLLRRTSEVKLVSLEARYSVSELVLEDNVFSLPPRREMIITPLSVVRSFIQRGNADANKAEVRVRDEHGNSVNP